MLRLKIQGFSNIISLCVLDAEIANYDLELVNAKPIEAKKGNA
jgi:hypothetical protein